MQEKRNHIRSKGVFGLGVAFGMCFLVSLEVQATLVISEIMATRGNPLVDEDQDRSDWIELFNSGNEPVALAGWGLTDQKEVTGGWQFSNGTLNSGEFLVVFASGKDCRDADEELHTDFKLRSSGEPLQLIDPQGAVRSSFDPMFPSQFSGFSYGRSMNTRVTPGIDASSEVRYWIPSAEDNPTAWRRSGFDDGDWIVGLGSLGYDRATPPTLATLIDTEFGETVLSASSTVLVRYRIVTSGDQELLRLRLRYDDGLVFYLNGREVFRGNAPSRLDYRSRATGVRSTEEVLDSKTLVLRQSDGLRSGENLLAFQMLNVRSNDRDFLLSVQADLIEQLDHLQGESRHFDQPSPGLPNEGGSATIQSPIQASLPSGLYPGVKDVILSSETLGGMIRYTIDGSIPDSRSPLYKTTLSISNATILRARSDLDGVGLGPISTWHYTIAQGSLGMFSSNLPVVVVDSFGQGISSASRTRGIVQIFEPGESGRARLDDAPTLSEEGTLKVRGSSTEGRPKKAYNLELQDMHGDDLDREVLGMPADSDWILYAPYNFDRALIRNAFMYAVSNQLGMYAVRTRFCEVYVNSRRGRNLTQASYAGVYVLMEKIKRGPDRVPVEKLLSKHTARPEVSGGYILKIDRLDPGDSGFSGGGQGLAHVYPKEENRTSAQLSFLRGHLDAFDRAVRGRTPTDPIRGYSRYIDVESFVDFHMLNEFSKNPDGLRLSTYMHLPRNGKLTMGPIWDFDRTLGPDDDARAANPRGRSTVYNFSWWGRLFRVPDFKQEYTDRWQRWRETVMTQDNLFAIIDSMAGELEEAQERNFDRWNLVSGNGGWRREIQQLKSWVERRLEWFDSEFPARPVPSIMPGIVGLGTEVGFGADDAEIFITTDGSDPRMPGGGVSQTARQLLPDERVVIAEGVIVTARTRVEERRGMAWSGPIRGVYLVEDVPRVLISEIMYHPADPVGEGPWSESDFEFIELRSAESESVTLLGASFRDGVELDIPTLLLEPRQPVLFVGNREAFFQRYPEAAPWVVGEFEGTLSNRGETILLEDAHGRVIARVDYEDRGDWDQSADGDGYSLELLAGAEVQSAPSSWKASERIGGSPGQVDRSLIVLSDWRIADGMFRFKILGLKGGRAEVQRTRFDTVLNWETIGLIEDAPLDEDADYSDLLVDGKWFYRVIQR
jgi:hypothetical protein